jgi:hypothetical protein
MEMVMKCAGMVVGASIVVFSGSTLAECGCRTAFVQRYPGTTLPARMAAATGSQSNVCHHPSSRSNPGNCYKDAISERLAAGRSIAQALADVELMDSDNDGVNNVMEITTPRADASAQVGYSPGLIGATGTDPCGAVGNVTNQPETPPPAGPTCDSIDFNNDGLFPNTSDITSFLTVFGGGACE